MKRFLLIWALFLCSLSTAFAQFSGSGSGTEDDPYLIFYAEQLNQMRNFLGKDSVYFKLMSDIDLTNWIEENSIHTNAPITINICPVGKELFLEGTQQLGIRDTLPDNEYRLYVRAYEYDGTLAVTAEIKLAVLPDEQYPWYEIYEDRYGELYSAGEKRSRFLSVELVSYEYSDLYKLMDE